MFKENVTKLVITADCLWQNATQIINKPCAIESGLIEQKPLVPAVVPKRK